MGELEVRFSHAVLAGDDQLPAVIVEAGPSGRFAYEEFFTELDSVHTIIAYRRDIHRFFQHVYALGLTLTQVTPKFVRAYLDNLSPVDPKGPTLSAPTKKRILAAIRKFFDIAVTRHVVILNPALSVKAPKHKVTEGKTPEISVEQARRLLTSVRVTDVIGLRDRAVLALMMYTGARVGAVAKLCIRNFYDTGEQWFFHLDEKGGNSREIPCRHDLQRFILEYIEAAGIAREVNLPLFRSTVRKSRILTSRPFVANDICKMVKRRLRDAGLPTHISPHSFRVAVATDLLKQDIPLEQVQYLLGHADARTTKLYDRRKQRVSRNLVERISI